MQGYATEEHNSLIHKDLLNTYLVQIMKQKNIHALEEFTVKLWQVNINNEYDTYQHYTLEDDR